MTEMALEVITQSHTLTLVEAGKRHNDLVKFVNELMVAGVDYGLIPGSKKPSLLKPGAEKLSSFFNLVPQFEELTVEEDWTGERHNKEPFFYYKIRCKLFRGDQAVAECIASINSWESKYRWRTANRNCPECGKPALLQSKDKPEWFCWRKKDGCGHTFPLNDARITSQKEGRVPNPDIFDQVNTLSKMGQKRALIGAVLLGVNASELFSQDLDEVVMDGSWSEVSDSKTTKKDPEKKPAATSAASTKYTQEQIGPEFDDPPLTDEHGNPVEEVRTVNQETGEVTTTTKPVAKPVEQKKEDPKKPELKKGEAAISAEFVEGALEYRTENGVKMVKWGEKWWRPALEVTKTGMTPALTDTLLAMFPYPKAGKPNDGKPNQYEAGNHLNNHFQVKLWSSLTWEQVAAVFSWKKFGIPDKRWYAKEYAEWSAKDNAKNGKSVETEPVVAAPVSSAPVVETKTENPKSSAAPIKTVREFYDINEVSTDALPKEEVDAFVANMEKLEDPTVLLPLLVAGMTIGNPKHAEHFFQTAQLLADKSVDVVLDESNQPDGEWKNMLDYIIGEATGTK